VGDLAVNPVSRDRQDRYNDDMRSFEFDLCGAWPYDTRHDSILSVAASELSLAFGVGYLSEVAVNPRTLD